MPLLFQSKGETYAFGVWEMTESLDLIMSLPSVESSIVEALKLSSLSRRQEWLTVRVLLHELVGEIKEIAYTPVGKPYLVDGSYQISISHTKGYVAVIISPSSVVSIDIEAYGDRIKRVAHRVFHPDEFFYPLNEESTFYELLIWSAKEVIVKTNKLSNINFREDLCVQPFVLGAAGSFSVIENQTASKEHFKINYIANKSFVLTFNYR
ncbi:4'-phosphopantetheinyl transferase family protein [Bacteroides propionicifaciens]|uniref:4'-phosphopantetheinyl transferase family protein n=1 Tax=Bacteroides propionicifaciens TaxID=392838 RepID=UPI00036C4E8D|nr:4'-phosphopantetheinyl transferase superfamily protein [Bacteroides propionicifaciens]